MNKKNEEVRNQQEKKGFIAIWDEMWQSIRKAIVPILYAIITIPSFFAVSYCICWQLMGNNICSYDKEIYDTIEEAIANNVVVAYSEENDGAETNAMEAAVIDTFRIMDTVDTCQSTRENEDILLECTVKNGYFKAIVRTRISKDCQITGSNRNYNSEKEYMDECQPIFALCVIGGCVVGWVVITAFVCLLIQVPVCIIKAIREKKRNKEETDNTDGKETKGSSADKKTTTGEDDFDLVDLDDGATETSKEVLPTSK